MDELMNPKGPEAEEPIPCEEAAPIEEKPIEEIPAEEVPAEEKPTGETPAEEKPAEEPRPRTPYFYRDGLTGFGFSQQGESHKRKGGIPCQDSSQIRCLTSRPIVLAAAADGVGSCALSHFGSAKAVQTALDCLETALEPLAAREDFVFKDNARMKELLNRAFTEALHAVENLAGEMEQLVYAFQSTLTLAIYDGSCLYFGHAGDDGIVAQCKDGTCQMVTARHKGETANSVVPLQAEQWQFGLVDREVCAFALMTDGVMDAVVGSELFRNRVYYPFFDPIFNTELTCEDDVQEMMQVMENYLSTPGYRERVSDDLTLVTVTNQNLLAQAKTPVFDQEAWDRESREIIRAAEEKLYKKDPPKQETPKPQEPRKPEPPKQEEPKPEAPKPEAPKAQPAPHANRVPPARVPPPRPVEPPKVVPRPKVPPLRQPARVIFTNRVNTTPVYSAWIQLRDSDFPLIESCLITRGQSRETVQRCWEYLTHDNILARQILAAARDGSRYPGRDPFEDLLRIIWEQK